MDDLDWIDVGSQEDRLTDVSDGVLDHVLSFLNAKEDESAAVLRRTPMTSATPRIRDRAYHIPVAQLLRRRHRPTDVVPQLVARACSTCRGTPSSSCDIEFCGTKASDTAELANLPRILGRFAAATWLRI